MSSGLPDLERCAWAMTSASRLAAPLPPLCVEEDEVVEEVVEPWMARLIQCSMLMLPSWLEVGVPLPGPEPSPPAPDHGSA